MLHSIKSIGHGSHLGVQHAAQQQHVGFLQQHPSTARVDTKTRAPLLHASQVQQQQQQHRPVTSVRFQPQQQQHQQQQQASAPSLTGAADVSSVHFVDGSAAAAMVSFLSAYGLDPPAIERLLQECPQLFEDSSSSSSVSSSSSSTSSTFGGPGSCTAGWSPYSYEEEAAAAAQEAAGASGLSSSSSRSASVYEVGRTLLFFHSLGWSHSSVMRRIIGLYPQLLTKQVERDILPVLAALADMGCSQDDVQLLVWEFPRIFVSSNWRRHVRKFQYLGLYGLPPPGHTTSSSSNSSSATDSLERLMRWF